MATEADLREELRSLHQKIDLLAEQVSFLHNRTQVVNEFTTELTPIVKDGMAALTDELEKLQNEFNTEEVVHLLRRTLQSTPRFVWLLNQLESASHLLEEFTPIARELMNSGIEWLDGAERKGYFRLLKGAAAMADQIGEHFEQKDIDALVANFATLMKTVKVATQPSMLAIVGAAASGMSAAAEAPPAPLSGWGMLKAMGDPDVQRGLGLMMEVLKKVARQANTPVLVPGGGPGQAKQLNGK